MKKETIAEIYETRAGSLLYQAGYRLHPDSHWRKTIDSAGCGLTPAEQEINRDGGRDYGKDAAKILSQEIAEHRRALEGWADDEIELNDDLYSMRAWLRAATA